MGPLEQWNEFTDVLLIQMQVSGNNEVKYKLLSILPNIFNNFSNEYFEEKEKEQLINSIMHSFVEIVLYPLQNNIRNQNKNNNNLIYNDLLLSSLNCITPLSILLGKAGVLKHYSPIICYLLHNKLHELPNNNLLSIALSGISSIIRIDNTNSNILSSCIHSFLNNVSSKNISMESTSNNIAALVTLLSLSTSCIISQSVHEKIYFQLRDWLNSDNNQIKDQILKVLLTWFKQEINNSVAIWYLQKVSTWIICYLINVSKSNQVNDSIILECIKILVLSHSVIPEGPSKSTMLSVLIPVFVGLLNQNFGESITSFSLTVIQSLAGTDPNSFKTIADSLQPSHRQLLEQAASIQQQKQQATQTKSSRAAKRSKPKTLTMDFSQYD